MKKFLKEFLFRGLICASGGPLVLAVIYGIFEVTGAVSQLTPGEVCMGILSLTLLAFIVAGMTAIYQVERLPLAIAILLHGGILYIAYIVIYLINGWLQRHLVPILVFTCIFISGYALIWYIIYFITKAQAKKLNRNLSRS